MHRKLNLKQRIGLCFAAFFAALAAQIVLSFYQSNTVLRQLDEQMGNFNAISRFQNGVERSLSAMEDYRWEYGDGEALLTELQGSFSVMNAWLWRIDGDLHTVSQEQYLLYRAVSTTYEHYNALVGQLETALRAGGETEAAQLYYNKVAPCGGYLRQYTQQLLNTAITDGQEEYTAVSALSDRVKWLQTVVGVLCLALGSLMALEVTRMLNPVQRMIEASRKVTEGRYDAPDLPVPRQDEMGRLAEAFNQMKHAMAQQVSTLQEKNDIERELHRQKTEALELQNRMERSRLQQLRSQIDPHFLFNTLNVILQTAGVEKAYRTQAHVHDAEALGPELGQLGGRFPLDAAGRAVDGHPLALRDVHPDELQNALQVLHGQDEGIAVGEEDPLDEAVVGPGPGQIFKDLLDGPDGEVLGLVHIAKGAPIVGAAVRHLYDEAVGLAGRAVDVAGITHKKTSLKRKQCIKLGLGEFGQGLPGLAQSGKLAEHPGGKRLGSGAGPGPEGKALPGKGVDALGPRQHHQPGMPPQQVPQGGAGRIGAEKGRQLLLGQNDHVRPGQKEADRLGHGLGAGPEGRAEAGDEADEGSGVPGGGKGRQMGVPHGAVHQTGGGKGQRVLRRKETGRQLLRGVEQLGGGAAAGEKFTAPGKDQRGAGGGGKAEVRGIHPGVCQGGGEAVAEGVIAQLGEQGARPAPGRKGLGQQSGAAAQPGGEGVRSFQRPGGVQRPPGFPQHIEHRISLPTIKLRVIIQQR